MSTLSKPLRRSVMNRQVAGVCGGIAEYFGLDATVVRVIYVLFCIFSGFLPFSLAYIILWAVIPEREYY